MSAPIHDDAHPVKFIGLTMLGLALSSLVAVPVDASSHPLAVHPTMATVENPLCTTTERVDVHSFPFSYRANRDAVHDVAATHQVSPLDVIRDVGSSSERCVFNRFLFLDFVLYFGLLDDVAPGARREDANMVRDELFANVAAHVVDGTDDGFSRVGTTSFVGASWSSFRALPDAHFPATARALRVWRGESSAEANDSLGQAELMARIVVDARTPFSSIGASTAWALANRPSFRALLSKLPNALIHTSCDVDVFAVTTEITKGDRGVAVALLGLFASQRFALLRDLAAFADDTLPLDDAQGVKQAFADGARAFFAMDSRGVRCGASTLLPTLFHDGALSENIGESRQSKNDDAADTRASGKPHHFFAVAWVSHVLAQLGVDDDDAIEAALGDAHTYKRAVFVPGVVYNLLLARPWNDGTAGDVDAVIAEQRRGAAFGVALSGDSDAKLVRRAVDIGSADRELIDVRWDDARTGALLVTVHERAGRRSASLPVVRTTTRTLRVDLGPFERRRLEDAGLPFPGVKLTTDTLVIVIPIMGAARVDGGSDDPAVEGPPRNAP